MKPVAPFDRYYTAMKCKLGSNKIRKIEKLTGKKVIAAFVRGGWDHFWAEVFFEGEEYSFDSPPPMVNYKSGKIIRHIYINNHQIQVYDYVPPSIFSPMKNLKKKLKIYKKDYDEGWDEAGKILLKEAKRNKRIKKIKQLHVYNEEDYVSDTDLKIKWKK